MYVCMVVCRSFVYSDSLDRTVWHHWASNVDEKALSSARTRSDREKPAITRYTSTGCLLCCECAFVRRKVCVCNLAGRRHAEDTHLLPTYY